MEFHTPGTHELVGKYVCILCFTAIFLHPAWAQLLLLVLLTQRRSEYVTKNATPTS